ncbi:MAG: hypothetical protein ABIH09_02005 [Candidatus Omnitrophota bacterium]
MNKYRHKHKTWIKIIAAGVVCLFLMNSIVWGDIKIETVTLSPEMRTTISKFRKEFEKKYFLLAHDAVNEHILGQIQKETNGDFSKMDQYEDEVISSEGQHTGVLVVSIKGLFKNTGQFAHIGFGSHERNTEQKPIIYIDSEAYYDEGKLQPARQIILMHEKNEIYQWLKKAKDLNIPLSELRKRWIKNNIEKAKKDAKSFHAAANENYNIEQLFNQYSYMLDWEAIQKAYKKHGLDLDDKKDINAAAFSVNAGKDIIADNNNMRMAIESILNCVGTISQDTKNIIESRLKMYMGTACANSLPGIRMVNGEEEWFFGKDWIRVDECNISLAEKDQYKFVSIADLAGLVLPQGKQIKIHTDVDTAVKGLKLLQEMLDSFPKEMVKKIESDESFFYDLICNFSGITPENLIMIFYYKNTGFTKTEIKTLKDAIEKYDNFLLIDEGYKPSGLKEALLFGTGVFLDKQITVLNSDNENIGTINGAEYVQNIKKANAGKEKMWEDMLPDGTFRFQIINIKAANKVMKEHPGYFPEEARINTKTWLKNNLYEWDYAEGKEPTRKQNVRYGLLSGFCLNAVEKFSNKADVKFLIKIGPALEERFTEEEIEYIDVEHGSELTYEKLLRIKKIFKEKAGDLLTDKEIEAVLIALREESIDLDSLYTTGWHAFDEQDKIWQQKLDEVFVEAVKRAHSKGIFNYSIETINIWRSKTKILGKSPPAECLKIIKRTELFEETIDREKGVTPEKMLGLYPDIPTDARRYVLNSVYKQFEVLVDLGIFERVREGGYCFSDIMMDQNKGDIYTKSLINAVCNIKYKFSKADEEKQLLWQDNIPKEKVPVVKELIKMTIFNQINTDQKPIIPKNKILWHIIEPGLLSEAQKVSSFIQEINTASKESKSPERIWLLKEGESIEQAIDYIKGICSNAIFDVALSNSSHIDNVPGYVKENEIKMLVFEGKVGDFSQIGGIIAALGALHLEEEKIIPTLLQIYAAINGSCYEGKIPLSSDLQLPRAFARSFVFKLPPAVSLPVDDIPKLNGKLLRILMAA